MEQVQRQRQSLQDEQEQPQAAPADLRDEELAENVSCCLAEIDSVLDEQETEEDKAAAEFEKIANSAAEGADIEDEVQGIADLVCPCGDRNCKGHPEQSIEYLPGR